MNSEKFAWKTTVIWWTVTRILQTLYALVGFGFLLWAGYLLIK